MNVEFSNLKVPVNFSLRIRDNWIDDWADDPVGDLGEVAQRRDLDCAAA
jgi:hypothetical protein